MGEDSQDESTTGSTSAPRLNPVAPDEDTLPSSLDGHESPTPPELSASAFSVDSDSSNSSVDIPLLPRREPAGTKRKAEVLSKESGKIGVTITTSSPSSGSGSPPPNKIPRLLPLKNNSTSPSHHVRISCSINCKGQLKSLCMLFRVTKLMAEGHQVQALNPHQKNLHLLSQQLRRQPYKIRNVQRQTFHMDLHHRCLVHYHHN